MSMTRAMASTTAGPGFSRHPCAKDKVFPVLFVRIDGQLHAFVQLRRGLCDSYELSCSMYTKSSVV